MPCIHMLCGPVGVGKTTYGRKLAEARRAVFFPLDDWMATLFAPDAPSTPDLQWALARTARCEAQIWKVADQVLARGLDVVVELGFFRREQRRAFLARAAQSGVPVQVHALHADREVRRARVRARNAGGDTLAVQVDDAMFEWAEGFYEPLEGEELEGAVRVDAGGGGGGRAVPAL